MQSSCQKKRSTSNLIKVVVSYHPESQVYKVKIKIKLMESYGWFAFAQFVSTANRDLSLYQNVFFPVPTPKPSLQKATALTLHKPMLLQTFTAVPRCCRHLRTWLAQLLFRKGEMQEYQKKSPLTPMSHHQSTKHQQFPFPVAFNEIKVLTPQFCLSLSPKIVALTKLELSFWSARKESNIKTVILKPAFSPQGNAYDFFQGRINFFMLKEN